MAILQPQINIIKICILQYLGSYSPQHLLNFTVEELLVNQVYFMTLILPHLILKAFSIKALLGKILKINKYVLMLPSQV